MLLIDKYKQMRSRRFLSQTIEGNYAFVGIGNHSINNLYPVLHHLQVPLKYICCTSQEKAELITRKYRGVQGVSSLDAVLEDESIKGVYISASERAHFRLAMATIQARKSLFIEKPPCTSLEELETLISAQKDAGVPTVLVGLQKRYAPAVQILRKQLKGDRVIDYTLQFHTGLYPEGGAATELFIHSIDLSVYLFGAATVDYKNVNRTGGGYTVTLVLRHTDGTIGRLDLSTHHSWRDAKDTLSVNTHRGEYFLQNTESLTYTAKQKAVMGIPVEKIIPQNKMVEYLYHANAFTPVMDNNQIVSQGYYGELNAFTRCVEQGSDKHNLTPLESLRSTFDILAEI